MKYQKINSYFVEHGLRLVSIASIIYTLIFSCLTLIKYFHNGYNALDLAIINQVFFNSSFGQWFVSTIHPPTYLGDHFSPFIIIMLPFYLLYRGPQTLLILQSLTLATSAIPIYLIARKNIGPIWGVVFSLIWLANPFVQNINLFEFSLMPFAVLGLWLMIYFYEVNKFWLFSVALILTLATREDTALVIVMFSAYAWLQKKSRRWQLIPLIAGIAYFILAIKVSGFFATSHQYKFLIYYPWLSDKLWQQPWLPLLYLFRINNWIFLLGLLLPIFYLPLFSMQPLVLALLIFGQLFLSSSGGGDIVLETHYVSLLLPAIFLAAIYAVKRFRENLKPTTTVALIRKHRPLVLAGLIAAVIYGSISLGPLGALAPSDQQNSDDDSKLVAEIPPTAVVAASYKFLPALSSRNKLYSLNYVFLGEQQFLAAPYQLPDDTEYLIVDWRDLVTYQLQYGFHPFYRDQYVWALKNWPNVLKGFELLDQTATTALLKKNQSPTNKPATVITNLPPTMIGPAVSIDDALDLMGYWQEQTKINLAWQLNKDIDRIYRLEFTYRKNDVALKKITLPWAYDLFYQTSPNQLIETSYWLGKTNLPPDTYDLTMRVLTINGGGVELNNWRSADDVIDQTEKLSTEIKLGSIKVE